jgi:hypothetical protein
VITVQNFAPLKYIYAIIQICHGGLKVDCNEAAGGNLIVVSKEDAPRLDLPDRSAVDTWNAGRFDAFWGFVMREKHRQGSGANRSVAQKYAAFLKGSCGARRPHPGGRAINFQNLISIPDKMKYALRHHTP